MVEDVATHKVADRSAYENITREMLASLDALESGSHGKAVDRQFHFPPGVLIGNHVRNSERIGRVPRGERIGGGGVTASWPEGSGLRTQSRGLGPSAVCGKLQKRGNQLRIGYGAHGQRPCLTQMLVVTDGSGEQCGA